MITNNLTTRKSQREPIYKHDVSLDSIFTKQSKEICALLMGPHPSMGGTMSNKVLRTIETSFLDVGFSVLRFDFRGVGLSQGALVDRSSDIHDALWIVDYINELMPEVKKVWIGGYGYGGYVALNVAMRRPCVNGFVAVTPHYMIEEGLMNLLTPCPNGAIFHGTMDSIVSWRAAKNLAKALHSQDGTKISFHPIEGADHSYKDHLKQLQESIRLYLQDAIENTQESSESETSASRA